jgi:hypothetical protein
MKIQRLFFTLLVVMVFHNAYSQSPGYLGKHFSVNMNLIANPALYSLNYFSNYYDAVSDMPGFSINATPSIGIEYVLGYSAVMGLNYKFNKLPHPLTLIIESKQPLFGDEYYVYYFGNGTVKNQYLELNLKIFNNNRGAIAPIGRYHQIAGIIGVGTFVEGDNIISSETDFVTLGGYEASGAGPYTDFILSPSIEGLEVDTEVIQGFFTYTYGQKTVLYNKIPVDIGIQVVLPFNFFVGGDLFGLLENEDLTYEGTVKKRSAGGLRIAANFGIGYFLF